MNDPIKNVKKAIKNIELGKLYNTNEIMEMRVIISANSKPSVFTIYRLIKSGKLNAIDIGSGTKSLYMVQGSELKRYLEKAYNL